MTENHTHSHLQVQKKKILKKEEKKSKPSRRAVICVCQVQMHIQSVKGHRGAKGEGVGEKEKYLQQYHEEFKAVSGQQESKLRR